MFKLQAQASVLSLHPREIMSELALGRRRVRGGVIGEPASPPTPPLGEVGGVDSLAAKEHADLTGLGASIGGFEDAKLLLGGKPPSLRLFRGFAHMIFGFWLWRTTREESAIALGLCATIKARLRDIDTEGVRLANTDVQLTPIEYKLLAELAKHPGRVFTHRALLEAVWGPSRLSEPHLVRVHMANLRRKMEEDTARPRYVLTKPGVGYRFADE